jgi:hypothetical protein
VARPWIYKHFLPNCEHGLVQWETRDLCAQECKAGQESRSAVSEFECQQFEGVVAASDFKYKVDGL